MANNISNNKTSHLISSQVPFFVRNDHETFVQFLEAYYEYLEQEDKAVNRAKNLMDYQNVDNTIDEFAEHLYDTFLKLVSRNVLADKALLLKNIKDFYRARGTEKSAAFLMRILFDEEVDFYYPKKDVLRASDGKWYVQKSLRIRNTKVNDVLDTSLSSLEKYISTQIVGSKSEATAIVERVDRFFEKGTQVDELVLSNINGEFDNGELIFAQFNDVEEVKTISSQIFSGIVNSITITNAGSLYQIGDPVILLSNTGAGACATVAAVTSGDLSSIAVLEGGAGYRANDQVLILGGGGSGASANVDAVFLDGTTHPNTYNIVASTISLEANTPLNNTIYSNLNSSIHTANANVTVANAMYYWTYANTGPVQSVLVISPGGGFISTPTLSVVSNNAIQSLGILGALEIVDGGSNYAVGDEIHFTNVPGGYGAGALANVWSVNTSASNAISEVRFKQMPGHIIGGSGYDMNYLPVANVVSGTGAGANVVVKSLLGYGATLQAANTTLGAIERIIIQSGGSGYTENPIVDLTGSGDGTATAIATYITGTFEYPGRYLNDDGHLSSYNFLQDRDYYQSFSYVIKTKQSIDKYRTAIKNLVHPSGTKLFGEHQLFDTHTVTVETDDVANLSFSGITLKATYFYTNATSNLTITKANHQLESGNTIYLEFYAGNLHNMASNTQFSYSPNGIYTVNTTLGVNTFTVDYSVDPNVSIYIGATHSGNVYLGKAI